MAALFASGRIIDIILGLVVLEAAALVGWRAHAGGWRALRPLLFNLASGAALMLAVRAALTGAAWTWVATCLAGAFFAHLGELRLRLRRASGRNPDATNAGTSAECTAFNAHP